MNQMSKQVVVRNRLVPGDPQKIFLLVQKTGFFSEAEALIAAELAKENLEKGADSGYEFVLLEESEQLIGYVCFGAIPATLSSYDLYWIVVDPSFQGQGWGYFLLQQAEAVMSTHGAFRVYIETSGRNQYESTRKFYVRSGYRQVACLEDFYAPGDDKVVYCRCLLPEQSIGVARELLIPNESFGRLNEQVSSAATMRHKPHYKR